MLFSTNVWSQLRASKASKICFINLYNEKVDVRLGEETSYVFIMEGLDPFTSTYLLKTSGYGEYKLYYKLSSEKKWDYWVDKKDVPYYCAVESGKSHCIVIDADGNANYFTLTEYEGPGARVCFFNGSDTKMSRMEVGTDWNDETVAYTEDLDSFVISNFVTIKSGNYSIFWQFPSQKRNSTWFYYPDSSGKNKEIFDFKNGSYYLFLAYTKGRDDYAVLYNITPR